MTTALLAFALAAAVLVVLPGPDSMLKLRAIAVSGRAGALRTAAGILTGLTVWIASASIGLAALLKASEVGYTTLRVVGALYL
ncbi:MAG: lysine transporter LysE, partial [Frankiales bacterium]|nr:lysine transporter LysE [Frankiales bacterium]